MFFFLIYKNNTEVPKWLQYEGNAKLCDESENGFLNEHVWKM